MIHRFFSKVEVTETCWLWQGGCSDNGYGMISRGGRQAGVISTHRYSYEIYFGDIPDDHVVMHTCDNRRCVNPAHLKLGSVADNNQDMAAKGRGRGRWSQKHCATCTCHYDPAQSAPR